MEETRRELPFVVLLAAMFGFAKAVFLGFMGIIGIATWNDVSESATINGPTNVVQQMILNTNRFYRLHRP